MDPFAPDPALCRSSEGITAGPEPFVASARRLSCRVIYLQATSEEPASVVDHLELEAEASYRLYQTTCW
jgi:hypothetical protein